MKLDTDICYRIIVWRQIDDMDNDAQPFIELIETTLYETDNEHEWVAETGDSHIRFFSRDIINVEAPKPGTLDLVHTINLLQDR